MKKLYGIIESNIANYQAILRSAFIAFLIDQGASEKTVKNYWSDVRHFLSWITTSQTLAGVDTISSHIDLLARMSDQTVMSYRNQMHEQNVPAATINRRLSALRMFFQSCMRNNWLAYHPMKDIANFKAEPTANKKIDFLSDFQTFLRTQGVSRVTLKNYTSDVRHFLRWLETKQSPGTARH